MTHYRTLFDAGKYLGSWHLPKSKDAIVIIESCSGGVLDNGSKKTRKPIVRLKGKTLLLALNKTNAKTISRLYGNDVDKWNGKAISLYVTQTRDPDGGGQCDGIRVRPSAPGANAEGGSIEESAAEAPQETP